MNSLALPVFVQTTVATQVLARLQTAHELGWMTSIQGPPGVGKTRAIQEYARRASAPVWHFSAGRDTAAVGPLMRALAQTFAGTKDMRTFENKRSIVIALREPLYLPLLVIDEAQNLRPDALEELRSVHDETGCGIVFAGNHSFLDRHGRELVNLLATPQFRSRLTAPLEISAVETEDAEAVARALGVPNAALTKRLALKAKGIMGLRAVERAAQLAEAIKSGPSVTAADYEAALKVLN